MLELGDALGGDGNSTAFRISTKPFLKVIRKAFEGKPKLAVDDPLAWWKSTKQLAALYPLVQYLWCIPLLLQVLSASSLFLVI